MRTRFSLQAAIPSCWLLALIAACACAPTLWAANPDLVPAPSARSLSRNLSPSLSNVQPYHGTEEDALQKLPPETRGDLLMIRQQYAAAIRAYQQCPRDSAVVWNKLGIAYQHMGALNFAKLEYQKALAINPRYSEALNNLGTIYYSQRNFHKAVRYYRKALRVMPKDAAYYSNLGTAYFAERKMNQGIEAYQSAFELDPDVFLSDSFARIESVATSADEQSQLNYVLAKLYAETGNFDAALHYLRLALTEGFDDRKKLKDDQEFSSLRTTPEFHQLMVERHLN